MSMHYSITVPDTPPSMRERMSHMMAKQHSAEPARGMFIISQEFLISLLSKHWYKDIVYKMCIKMSWVVFVKIYRLSQIWNGALTNTRTLFQIRTVIQLEHGSTHTGSSGKAGSCLPLVGSLQYTTLANSMYWFPLPFQLPVVI